MESKEVEEASPKQSSKRAPVSLEERPTASHVVSFTENNDTEEESLRVTIVSEKDSKTCQIRRSSLEDSSKKRKSKP